jgi:homoserine/homoserine lactone efflux protein
MSMHLYFAYVITCFVLAITPGPNMSLFLANGTAHGTRAALLTICGTATGNTILATAAALGMGSIMTFTAEWFDVVRWIGAAYLVWLGYVRLRAAFAAPSTEMTAAPRPDKWLFQGVAVSLSNPKVLLFLGAFFPQFIEPGTDVAPQLALMAVTFVAVLTGVDALLAVAFTSARGWLAGRGRKITDGVSGVMLICGGLWLAAAKR